MITDFQEIISTNVKGMKRSAIRELLKLTQDPEIISFAGGLPDPELFPIEELKKISNEVLDSEGTKALQYGSTEGDTKLREILVDRYKDTVICGLPSYLGGLGAFNAYGAERVGIPFDDSGMRSDLLENKLEELKKQGIKPKFIYVIPDFQNPAGITMPEKRRIEIIEIAKKYDILIVEDSPYKELRFEGKSQKSIFALDNSGHVITLGTFSKIFVPGFRIGWVIANAAIVDKFVVAKQNTDLCTSPFVQKIAAKYIEKGLFDKSLKKIISTYYEKKKVMIKAFEDYMPEGVSWTNPEGGLFLSSIEQNIEGVKS